MLSPEWSPEMVPSPGGGFPNMAMQRPFSCFVSRLTHCVIRDTP
jgi:hypothetical protein